MTTETPTKTPTRAPHEGLALREEDLEVGRRFVHPETRLEYEDFHAYFLGKDPIPHWRNARIKEFRREGRTRGQLWLEAAIAPLFACYDRNGRSTFNFDSRDASTSNFLSDV